ncbi:hypothetical protein [Psychrosphaera algicola]|uniref:Uncharacterized protein n=1 Tax=Psychrosphaera algicola TaxID=3023714 RepID=A0ABT5FH09_9GAMM|nr:hypothetical protein [Psychrosphaera sp. G1-22]MDC2890452.1 hypothetical protein [Psychrosphaera sp. G1-22]
MTLKVMIGDRDLIGARTAVAMVLNARLGKGAQKSNWGLTHLSQAKSNTLQTTPTQQFVSLMYWPNRNDQAELTKQSGREYNKAVG